nr:H/ACA ribonucleoprotein complex subunit GAR1-like [Procambarus clarkii]
MEDEQEEGGARTSLLSGYIRTSNSTRLHSQQHAVLDTQTSFNMKFLSLMLVMVVALAALMGSARAMPDPYALADPDPAADPQFGFGRGGFGRGGFGRGGFGRGGFGRGGFGRGFGRRFGGGFGRGGFFG